jgi:hypothetical protein
MWRSPDGLRIAELLPTAEVGLFVRRAGGTVRAWGWDSVTFTAYRLGPPTLPDAAPAHPQQLLDPAALVRLTLATIDPTTRVSVGVPGSVAGRPAYRLIVQPRSSRTLVGRIEVWLDAARRVPLGVSVFARGATSPALSVVFSSVSFAPIDPTTFDFVPPSGATVIGLRSPALGAGPSQVPAPRREPGERDGSGAFVRTFGDGWETVLAVAVPANRAAHSKGGLDLPSLLPLSGSLFSVRLVNRPDHPWLLLGAVPPARLAAVEQALP